jgi:hypothetical protein
MNPVLTFYNADSIVTSGNYSVPMFDLIPAASTALTPHTETTLINNTNINNVYYMMYDNNYTYSPTTCDSSPCATYSVDCQPPYDWSPKSYSYNLNTNQNPSTYDAPAVMDCLGRTMTVYDPQTPRYPGGASLNANDSAIF